MSDKVIRKAFDVTTRDERDVTKSASGIDAFKPRQPSSDSGSTSSGGSTQPAPASDNSGSGGGSSNKE